MQRETAGGAVAVLLFTVACSSGSAPSPTAPTAAPPEVTQPTTRAHVTVRNVRLEESSRSFYRVKGTVINSGSRELTGFLDIHSRFWSDSDLLLAEDRDFIEVVGTLPVNEQRTFDILIRKSDIAGWSYYTLVFTDDDEAVPCDGCAERRRE